MVNRGLTLSVMPVKALPNCKPLNVSGLMEKKVRSAVIALLDGRAALATGPR